jgi:hypothetical protein
LGKGGAVQAAELDAATRSNNRDFSRSFLRHFERQCMSDSVDREITQDRACDGHPEREWLEFPIETAPSPYPADERKPKAAFMQRSGTRSNDSRELLPWEYRPMTKKITLEQKWYLLSEAAKKEAEKLPHGKEREALLRKARQLETASQIDQWISSPALQPPT